MGLHDPCTDEILCPCTYRCGIITILVMYYTVLKTNRMSLIQKFIPITTIHALAPSLLMLVSRCSERKPGTLGTSLVMNQALMQQYINAAGVHDYKKYGNKVLAIYVLHLLC